MSTVTPLPFSEFVDTTDSEQRWQIYSAVLEQRIGYNGGSIVGASSSSGTGTWSQIQFITAGTLTAYSGNITGTVTGVTFPAGTILYGLTNSLTTGTGTTVVLYTA